MSLTYFHFPGSCFFFIFLLKITYYINLFIVPIRPRFQNYFPIRKLCKISFLDEFQAFKKLKMHLIPKKKKKHLTQCKCTLVLQWEIEILGKKNFNNKWHEQNLSSLYNHFISVVRNRIAWAGSHASSFISDKLYYKIVFTKINQSA